MSATEPVAEGVEGLAEVLARIADDLWQRGDKETSGRLHDLRRTLAAAERQAEQRGAVKAWDEGVDAAFRGAITRQNAADVKRTNPYRALAAEHEQGR